MTIKLNDGPNIIFNKKMLQEEFSGGLDGFTQYWNSVFQGEKVEDDNLIGFYSAQNLTKLNDEHIPEGAYTIYDAFMGMFKPHIDVNWLEYNTEYAWLAGTKPEYEGYKVSFRTLQDKSPSEFSEEFDKLLISVGKL